MADMVGMASTVKMGLHRTKRTNGWEIWHNYQSTPSDET